MALTIPALESTTLLHGLLIKLTVNNNQYFIANTYRPIVWNGNTYNSLGHFLGMNELQDDLRSTNNNIQITLSGIPKDPGEAGLPGYNSFVDLILQTDIKGSRVQIYRAFFDPVTREFLSSQTSLRFSGYINNYTLTDSIDAEAHTDTNTLVIQCSSINAILEKSITGRRTNSTDQKALYPSDTSMDRVVAISRTSFDFGKPYTPPAE
jgi:hypothetical protein